SFHLSRIKGLSTIFTSPINYETFNYTGYGVNYFYPFLTFFPAVMLYWMTKNLIVSYIIYVWLLNLCTTLVAYHYGERFLKQKKAAFLFSCLYIFSAYRTVDIYYRSAIAEAIAITLVIPVLFYAYQIISGKEEKYPSVKLALSMSLLVYSHVLS
ncbi:TPA: 6-pyruvoyl-tetrahydropterin synthase-related protein, partial [Enterococcus faecium]